MEYDAVQISCSLTETAPPTDKPPVSTKPHIRPTLLFPPPISPDNFCATKGKGLYAKPDAPGSFYNCAHGITWIQHCPVSLVFKESCKCCQHAIVL